ncbi:hypothetical protein [Lysobacter gummosus]
MTVNILQGEDRGSRQENRAPRTPLPGRRRRSSCIARRLCAGAPQLPAAR